MPGTARSANRPFLQLIVSRAREFYREPAAIFWVYGFPLLMVIALGVAFRSRPVEQFRVDVQQSPNAKQVAEDLAGDPRIEVAILDTADCRVRVRTGKSDVMVAAPRTPGGSYALHYDPSKPGSVVARNAVDNLLQRAAGRTDPVDVRDVEMNEPGGRYIDFLVPGLIGMGLMGGGLWGVGFVTVDMRLRKLLKRFMATPMRKSHFLASIMISRMIFMVPEFVAVLVFARVFFGVVIHGSLLGLIALIFLGSVMFAGLGLLVACRASTLETISGLMNVVMLPMWILSGIFFSTDRFPEVVQPLIDLLPLTPLIASMRAVMLEGASMTSQAPEIIVMLVWSLVTFVLALRWFRWT